LRIILLQRSLSQPESGGDGLHERCALSGSEAGLDGNRTPGGEGFLNQLGPCAGFILVARSLHNGEQAVRYVQRVFKIRVVGEL
jgi:hypothetical protein